MAGGLMDRAVLGRAGFGGGGPGSGADCRTPRVCDTLAGRFGIPGAGVQHTQKQRLAAGQTGQKTARAATLE
jgi:hypothetical protein